MSKDIRYRVYDRHNVGSYLEINCEVKSLLDNLVRYELSMYPYTPEEIEKLLYSEGKVYKTISEELLSERCKMITASHEGKLVGYILVGLEHDDVVYIRNVVVDENYRLEGVGRNLMKMVDRMRDNLPLEVTVVDKNEGAIKYYQKFGFEIIDKYEPYILLRK